MSEITTFIASKIKTEVKKDANLDWMLPHFVNSKETNEFVCYTFYCTTVISKKGDDGKYTPRYKEQKMIVWNEYFAKKLDEQIKQGATHFSGLAELKSFHRETIKDNNDKPHTFYENLEYWVSSGVATTVYKQPKDNDGNNNFSNYSNKNATAEQTTTPDVDDDIPF